MLDKINSLSPAIMIFILLTIMIIVLNILKALLKLLLPKKSKNFSIFIAIALLIWFIISQNTPSVTYHNIYFSNLPKNLNGYKITQISDIHLDSNYNFNIKKSFELIKKENSDLLVFTGDAITKQSDDFEKAAKLFENVKNKDGIYAILGNHDYYNCDHKSMKYALKKNNLILLENANKKIKTGLYIVGVEDAFTAFPDTKKAFQNIPEDNVIIFLSHSTEIINSVPNKDMLMLTGHTHGGQICVPFIDKKKMPRLSNEKYIEGYYKIGKIQLYVNRGIGYIKPAIRLFAKPEISVFTLKNKE